MISYFQLRHNKQDILLTECGAPDEENSSEGEHGSQGLLSNGIKGSSQSLTRSCECLEGAQECLPLQTSLDYSAVDLVGAYIRTASPIAGVMIANRDAFGSRLASSELIYNLSDVEKFLPKLPEDAERDEWSVETVSRKRKERQDSGSSSIQERKVIRSNSEERSSEGQNRAEDNIRRVSSHEDFEKNKKLNRAAAVPLHEQNHGDSPIRSLATDSDYNSFYSKDGNVSSGISEKYSHLFAQNLDNDHSSGDFYRFRQKYSKNDSSPSRSRIHEYILFPKRISPNRDPNADSAVFGAQTSWSGLSGPERDHERTRCSERRSRTPAPRIRRGPPRRQAKQRSGHQDYSKENYFEKSHSLPPPHSAKKSEMLILSGEKLLKSDIESSNLHRAENRELNVNSYPPKEWIEEVKLVSHCAGHSPAGTANTRTDNVECKREKIRDRSQSPAARSVSPVKKTPMIDLTMLHEQLGQNEPIPSMPRKLVGFPWDSEECQTIPNTLDLEPLRDENVVSYDKRDISNIRDQRRTLPEKCDEKTTEKSGIGYSVLEPDERLNKIAKKLQVLKKKIAKCEADFEQSHGFRASHADKMNDEVLSKLYVDMRRLKNERKAIKAGPVESMSRPIPTENASGESLKNKPMTEIMGEIERRLEVKRITHGRPQKLEECTYIQLAEEKAAVQRALLWLEGARGRPTDKGERDTARPLYDRYRAVKRLVARYETAKANSSIGELATIMEHETMLFTNLDSPIDSPDSNDKPNQSDSGTSTTDLSEKRDSEDPTSSSAKSTASDDTNIISSSNISNENLHCLPLKELNRLLIETKNLKTSLRRNIKTFEAEFEVQNSRKLLKDERQNVLPSYSKYKETKARLRLLNALVNKQKKAYG